MSASVTPFTVDGQAYELVGACPDEAWLDLTP